MDLSHPISAVIPSLDGEVLTVLAGTTLPLSGARIADIIGTASGTGVRRVLRRLEDQGLVNSRTAGKADLYEANRDHYLWGPIQNLIDTASNPTLAIGNRTHDVLRDRLGPDSLDTTVAIYGSVARGESTTDSDLDLLLVTPKTIESEDAESAADELRARLQPLLGNAVNIYVLNFGTLASLIERGDPMVDSWLADSQTIHGPDLRPILRSRS